MTADIDIHLARRSDGSYTLEAFGYESGRSLLRVDLTGDALAKLVTGQQIHTSATVNPEALS